ncbi:arginine--tRNA ligase, partial [Patescibacteria group bacterium]|nr:arginine--tRNA ligase [Patescibacteria group bacterium]
VAEFPNAVRAAAESNNPSKIAAHIYELAKSFNVFYNQLPVLRAETEVKKQSRLAICACTAQTIQIGLGLLGIESPNKM